MTSNVKDIRSYSFQNQDHLLLDANIWLNVYGPIAYKRKHSAIYSRALANICKACCCIYIDVLILSEFINGYARLEHKQSPNNISDFKIFRKSQEFKYVARDIAQNAKRILKHCKRCDSFFATADVEALLSKFDAGESDFNDQMIAEICRRNRLKLLTDDPDFKESGIEILTANEKLLTF